MGTINQKLGPQFVIQAAAEQLTLEVGIKSSSLFQNSGGGGGGGTTTVNSAGGNVAITAAVALGVYRAVTYAGTYADSTTVDLSNYAGVTLAALTIGETAAVKRVGNITEATWTWTPNAPVFISANGILTQTPPSLPLRRVGWAMSATQLNLDPFPIIGV